MDTRATVAVEIVDQSKLSRGNPDTNIFFLFSQCNVVVDIIDLTPTQQAWKISQKLVFLGDWS